MSDTFQGLPVIRKTSANKLSGRCTLLIHKDMELESSWGWREHTRWVSDLTGLSAVTLTLLVGDGYVLLTDEHCSQVWLLSQNKWNTTARLIHDDED